MATSTSRFAAKTKSIAPLTDRADAFSAASYARPDFATGRIVVANYEFPETQRFDGFRPSYSTPPQPPQSQEGSP